MRIHSDILEHKDIVHALRTQRDLGRVGPNTYTAVLNEHGSRKRARAWEIKLEAIEKIPGDGRRFGNSGGYGSTSQTTGEYSATYDEWGWFLAELYRLDPDLITPYYENVQDFHEKTGMTYNPMGLLRYIGLYGEDPYPYVYRKPQAGRFGYNRVTEDRAHFSAIYMPRTLEDVTEFSEGVHK